MLTRLTILFFVLGAGLLQQQASLPDMRWLGLLLPIIATLIFLRQSQSVTVITTQKILLCLIFLGIGFFWANFFAQSRLADALPQVWEGQDIELIGVVANLPQSSDRNVRFRFDVEQVLTPDAVVPRHISLSWYRNRDIVSYSFISYQEIDFIKILHIKICRLVSQGLLTYH